tara:strand:- start:315 stop:596 length:282 start_codon:yes stop_codon:yes gene_type:complete
MEFKEFDKQQFNIDITKLLMEVLKTSITNRTLIEKVIETQIVMSKKIEGDARSEDNSFIFDKLNDILEQVDSDAREVIYKIIPDILSDNQKHR